MPEGEYIYFDHSPNYRVITMILVEEAIKQYLSVMKIYSGCVYRLHCTKPIVVGPTTSMEAIYIQRSGDFPCSTLLYFLW